MARILLIGDPHLKITKFDLSQKFLTWITEIIVSEKPDLVVNLGDTFDTHSVLRSEVMTEFMSHVYGVLNICPYIYVIGNHDQYKPNDSRYHALSHIKNKIKNFTIVDKTMDIDNITYVPYTHDPNSFPGKTKAICIAHQTFKGADYGDIITKDGVDASRLQGTEIVISGHIHKRQTLDMGRVHILYPGSPFSQGASDIDQIKGISILDTDTLTEKFITCPLPMWRSLSLSIGDDMSISDVQDTIVNSVNDKDSWIIDLNGPKTEITGLLESKKFKNLIKPFNLKFKIKFTDKEKKKIRLSAVSVDDIVNQYIDQVYTGSLDKEALKIKAKEIHDLS